MVGGAGFEPAMGLLAQPIMSRLHPNLTVLTALMVLGAGFEPAVGLLVQSIMSRSVSASNGTQDTFYIIILHQP